MGLLRGREGTEPRARGARNVDDTVNDKNESDDSS